MRVFKDSPTPLRPRRPVLSRSHSMLHHPAAGGRRHGRARVWPLQSEHVAWLRAVSQPITHGWELREEQQQNDAEGMVDLVLNEQLDEQGFRGGGDEVNATTKKIDGTSSCVVASATVWCRPRGGRICTSAVYRVDRPIDAAALRCSSKRPYAVRALNTRPRKAFHSGVAGQAKGQPSNERRGL
jgi:hypothetical protein